MWLNDCWTTRMSPDAVDFSPTLSGDLAEKIARVTKGLRGLVRELEGLRASRAGQGSGLAWGSLGQTNKAVPLPTIVL